MPPVARQYPPTAPPQANDARPGGAARQIGPIRAAPTASRQTKTYAQLAGLRARTESSDYHTASVVCASQQIRPSALSGMSAERADSWTRADHMGALSAGWSAGLAGRLPAWRWRVQNRTTRPPGPVRSQAPTLLSRPGRGPGWLPLTRPATATRSSRAGRERCHVEPGEGRGPFRVPAKSQAHPGHRIVQGGPVELPALCELQVGSKPNTSTYPRRLRRTSLTGTLTWWKPTTLPPSPLVLHHGPAGRERAGALCQECPDGPGEPRTGGPRRRRRTQGPRQRPRCQRNTRRRHPRSPTPPQVCGASLSGRRSRRPSARRRHPPPRSA